MIGFFSPVFKLKDFQGFYDSRKNKPTFSASFVRNPPLQESAPCGISKSFQQPVIDKPPMRPVVVCSGGTLKRQSNLFPFSHHFCVFLRGKIHFKLTREHPRDIHPSPQLWGAGATEAVELCLFSSLALSSLVSCPTAHLKHGWSPGLPCWLFNFL